MDKDFIGQVIAEIIHEQSEALALVVAALARQMDATKLANDLRAQLSAAKQVGNPSPHTIYSATHVLAAVEAEILLRKPQGKH